MFYPRGAHDCFNVLADLRPRMVAWLARQIERHHGPLRPGRSRVESEPEAHWNAAEAVDPEFADALLGDVTRMEWRPRESESLPAHWRPNIVPLGRERLEVVHRLAGALPVPTLNGAAGR